MISLIIFSFDQPASLRALLESIQKKAKSIFKINVLYKTSSETIEIEYLKLTTEFIGINYVSQKDFKKQTIELLDSSLEHVCFFSDGDIIYGNIQDDLLECFDNQNIFCFSLRLGKNIEYCYRLSCNNVFIPSGENEKHVWWNWVKHYSDFGFPLSLNGHIFRTKEIKKLVKNTNFNDVNSLEEGLQAFDNFPKEEMASYLNSVVVNNISSEIINYDLIDFSEINSCYKKLEIKK